MNIIKKYNKIFFVFFFVLILTILVITNIYKCPLKYFTGIPCPLCGMTRALLSVLKFDFNSSFYYHALWPVAAVVLPIYFFIKLEGIKINRKLENIICIIIGILLIIYYILRHYYGSPIVVINFHDSLIYKIFIFFKNL